MSQPDTSDTNQHQRLDTWGEIAGHLGVSVRTAQEWEKAYGLPAKRVGGRVYAYKNELDAWRKAREAALVTVVQVSEAVDVVQTVDPPEETAGFISTELSEAAKDTTGEVSSHIETVADDSPRSSEKIRSKAAPTIAIASALIAIAAYVIASRRPSELVPNLGPAAPRVLARLSSEHPTYRTVQLPGRFDWIVSERDGRRVYLYGLRERKIAAIDVASLAIRVLESPTEVRSLAVSADGSRLLVGSTSDGLVELNPRTGQVLRQTSTGGPVANIAITPDGNRVYLAMAHRGVRRLSLKTGEWKQITTQGCPYFSTVDWQGKRLLVSYQCGGPTGRDGHDAVEIFNLPDEVSAGVYSGVPLVGTQHEFSRNGDFAWLDGGDACMTKIYDFIGCGLVPSHANYILRLSDLKIVQSLFLPMTSGVQPIFFDGDSRVLFASGANEVRVFETSLFTTVETYRPNTIEGVKGTTVIADGERVLMIAPTFTELWDIPAIPAFCQSVGPGLIHLLSGDGSRHDSVQNAYVEPSTTYKPGFIGQAFEFKGSERSTIQAHADSRFGLNDSTLLLYFKPTLLASGTLLEWGKSKSPEGWTLRMTPEGVEFTFAALSQEPAKLFCKRSLSTQSWTHVAVTKTASSLRLFVDGVLADEVVGPPERFRIQRETDMYYRFGSGKEAKSEFQGLVDEVAISAQALDAQKILSLYQRRLAGSCKP